MATLERKVSGSLDFVGDVKGIKKASKTILIVTCIFVGNMAWAFLSPCFFYWPSVIISIAINVTGLCFNEQARSKLKRLL